MPDYDFRSLSPIDFEELIRDLLNADLGLRLASFGVGPDGGVDLRDAQTNAVTIAQCKHRPDAKKAALVSSAAKEASRWAANEIQEYLFVVSCPVTPGTEVEIRKALAPLPAGPHSVWHHGAINAALARNPRVEKDHFKLWLSSTTALEQVIAAAQWQRSEALLQRVHDRVRLYVHTPSYGQAMKMLKAEHVVLISGAPGVGKSTLAEMILLSYWHEGWTIVDIASDIDEAWRRMHRAEDKVVFYYDDFLGQTNVAELQKNEASDIALLVERVRRGNSNQRLVLTTRQQVLAQAQHGGDDRARRLANSRPQLRLELTQVSRSARARMLFNHLHFGFTHTSLRSELASDTRYRQVVDHEGFNPRILESVALGQEHASVDDFYAALFKALDHPDEIWAGSFKQLSRLAIDILFQLAVWPSVSMSLERIRSAVDPGDPRDWRQALKVLENTWIRLIQTSGVVDRAALFDASRRDYLLDLLDEPTFFDEVLTRISSVQQLNYLLRLANVLDDALDAGSKDKRPALQDSIARRLNEIDGIATAVARNELAKIAQNEATHQIENLKPEPPSRKTLVPKRRVETLRDRIQILTELASICFRSEIPTQAASGLLRTELEFFDSGLDESTSPRAPALFGLAARLASRRSPKWLLEYAATITQLAFDSIREIDDIRSYSELPQWFRDGPFHEIGQSLLEDAIYYELDGIEQQDDRDVMSDWLDEVISVAQEHGIDPDVGTLRQRIEEMTPSFPEESYEPTRIPDNSATADGTDEELADLFAKLI